MKEGWIFDFFKQCRSSFPDYEIIEWESEIAPHRRLILVGNQIIIHPISLIDNCSAEYAIVIQQHYAWLGITLVHLWEDIWMHQNALVISRISALIGYQPTHKPTFQRVFARKTIAIKATPQQAQQFYKLNHQLGYAKQKYHYALRYEGEILAMASFGSIRIMPSKGDQYSSSELSRFSVLQDTSIPGALSKLIKAFIHEHPVNDIMTYADRDWTLGNTYLKVGFQLDSIQEPQIIYYHQPSGQRFFKHRLPKYEEGKLLVEHWRELGYKQIFNTGNLKFYYAV
ncbi:MAG: hypothetical protein EOO99_03215 [Pedobacter sp.]|jgi:hypothetical protein|nr:MAG: hypothetical protein EOO99_03215 [Pedobacter sp.]